VSRQPSDVVERSGNERLGEIVSGYAAVTERLRESHERLRAEVKRLGEELADKNRELARRQRLAALGQMAAGLAHEIRNPLGGILLYASLLEKELKGDVGRLHLVKRITSGVRSLEGLLTDILAFAGENQPQLRRTNVGRVMDQVTQMLWARLKELRTRLHVEAGLNELELKADPLQLRSALANLVLNAAEAAGRGGQVRVLASPGDEAGDGVRICVQDNGPGIPSECLDRIFDPFFTTKARGTGLGLAIVHRIAEAHGGAVWGRNRPENGAEFVLELPAAREPKARRGSGHEPPGSESAGMSQGSPRRGTAVRG